MCYEGTEDARGSGIGTCAGYCSCSSGIGRNRWQLCTGIHRQKLGSGEILYSDGTGMVWPYRPNGSGGFITPPGGNATLTLVAGSSPSRYELNFHGRDSTYGFVRAVLM